MALSRKRRLTIYLLGMSGWAVVATVGVALTPTLIGTKPVVLLALSPSWAHLVTIAPVVDPVVFFVVTTLRLLGADPFWYFLGRDFGADAVNWAEQRVGPAARLYRFLERLFARASWLIVFLAPYGFICLLAGAARMPLGRFFALNLAGTLSLLAVVRLFGQRLEEPIKRLIAWIDSNSLVLTIAIVLLLVVAAVARRRGSRDPRRVSLELELDGSEDEAQPKNDDPPT